MPDVERLLWPEVASAPEMPGVYAWYYSPRFSTHDLDEVLSQLDTTPDAGLVSDFLQKRLLAYFAEDPYHVSVRGQLKPTYVGELSHQQVVAPDLAARLAQSPERLRHLGEAIKAFTPFFCAPLYIGMASNLRTRLRQHKSLISRALERPPSPAGRAFDQDSDHSFATEIVRRRIPTESLSVYIMLLPNTQVQKWTSRIF